ncbi:MAG: acylphosphatase [Bradyrhizobiaceae bacterium]|nr:MAG: acylphosphatase [Bradyrhizobiaceae bacterium]
MQRVIRRIAIRGRVQGVGFRAWTQAQALAHGVEGWVRNRRDGCTVEAVFAGSAQAVADMVEACRCGPPGANVIGLDQFESSEAELALRGNGGGFAGLPTV